MNIIKILGIDTERLAKKKIRFNTITGEFTTTVRLGFCCAFEQVVQVAKFDFLNMYIPSIWYLNKSHLPYKSYCPSENKRIIQPYLSKNKGCTIIPNVDIVSKKYDITSLIINSFKEYEECVERIKKKWDYRLSSDERTPDFSRIETFVRTYGLKLGEDNLILNRKYYAYPKFTVNDREYAIITPYDLSYSYYFRIVDGVFRQAIDWKEEFWEDFTSPKNEQMETIRAIRQAGTLRGGHRLSKFLFQCSMIKGVQVRQRSNVFALKNNGTTFAVFHYQSL